MLVDAHGKAGSAAQEAGAGAEAEAARRSGRQQRTPQSAFDGAAGKDVYEPEKIVGKRLSKGVTQRFVKWVWWKAKESNQVARAGQVDSSTSPRQHRRRASSAYSRLTGTGLWFT